mgnify:CR=1 FL=1
MAVDRSPVRQVEQDSFEPAAHFYPRVLNARMHPLVRSFLSLGNARIAQRYAHLHPEADPAAVREALGHCTKFMRWAGADLLHATDEEGRRRMVIVETNSCPSGQKSTPIMVEEQEQAGYQRLIERSFLPLLQRRQTVKGELAVLFDKNEVETSGYAAAIADATGEPVWLVPFFDDDGDPPARFDNGILHVRSPEGSWRPIRAAFRYVTQRPWNRIPALTRTHMLNPVLACRAGGRNKMLAAKAYDFHNAALQTHGLQIHVPETIWDVSLEEVPLWLARMGGFAVVKDPYSNAGQGVYTITNAAELDAFMNSPKHRYDRFIVQSLVGNHRWSSKGSTGRLYQVGTVPNRKGNTYVADLRVMIGVGVDGFYPVALYARRARAPLSEALENTEATSWDMLGTNLSVKSVSGGWGTEPERLIIVDERDFNTLGLGLDDLIEAYIQTVLAVTAIDNMAKRLVTQRGRFRQRFFGLINSDPALAAEVCS